MAMFSWMHSALEVRSNGSFGKGIYAREPLAKGTRLAVFGGYIITLEEEETSFPEEIRDYAHQIDDDIVIGIRSIEEVQDVDHFNHSCEPNAGFKGQIFLLSMRDIAAGEEVTFDYAMTLAESEHASLYKLDCECGAQSCRKLVTDSDWRNQELQDKYRGYFQYYVQKKIDDLSL